MIYVCFHNLKNHETNMMTNISYSSAFIRAQSWAMSMKNIWIPRANHYSGVIIITMASQIASLTIVYSTVYSDVDQRKHCSSASLAFVRVSPGTTKGQWRGKRFHLMTSSWCVQLEGTLAHHSHFFVYFRVWYKSTYVYPDTGIITCMS